MKKIIYFVLCVIFPFCVNAQRLQEVSFFEGSFSNMKKEVARVNKPFFIYFYSLGCYPCSKMDSITFENPEVVSFVEKNFFPCKADGLYLGDGGIELAQRLNVTRFPTVIIFDRSGTPIYEIEGYMEPKHFLGNLKQELANLSYPNHCPATARHYDPSENAIATLPENKVIYPQGFKFDVPAAGKNSVEVVSVARVSGNNSNTPDNISFNRDASWYGDMPYSNITPAPYAGKPAIAERGAALIPVPKVPVGEGAVKKSVAKPAAPAAAPAKTKSYGIQVGAYENLEWANHQLNVLKEQITQPVRIVTVKQNDKVVHKVIAGNYSSRAQADERAEEVRKYVEGCFIISI